MSSFYVITQKRSPRIDKAKKAKRVHVLRYSTLLEFGSFSSYKDTTAQSAEASEYADTATERSA